MKRIKAAEFLSDVINKGEYAHFAAQSHQTWMNTKLSQGWTYGPVRNNDKKINEFLLPYDQLPVQDQARNQLTPYAVTDYFRQEARSNNWSLYQLYKALDGVAAGKDEKRTEGVSEHVHTHFVAALFFQGFTVGNRTEKDMGVYESLTPDQRSWDRNSGKEVASYLREMVAANLATSALGKMQLRLHEYMGR